MPRYHVYRTGGAYIGPAPNLRAAERAVHVQYQYVAPGEPCATVYVENELGVLRLHKTYYRPLGGDPWTGMEKDA